MKTTTATQPAGDDRDDRDDDQDAHEGVRETTAAPPPTLRIGWDENASPESVSLDFDPDSGNTSNTAQP